jgi:hypothetical protein
MKLSLFERGTQARSIRLAAVGLAIVLTSGCAYLKPPPDAEPPMDAQRERGCRGANWQSAAWWILLGGLGVGGDGRGAE